MVSKEIKQYVAQAVNQAKAELTKEYDIKLANLAKTHANEFAIYQKTMTELVTSLINSKDETINKLNREVGELTKSVEYTSKDTEENTKEIENVNTYAEKNSEYISLLKDRANASEDQSRRYNLLFFDIEEEEKYESPTDCEQKVVSVLQKICGQELESAHIERAHRLGKQQKDSGTGKIKTRPMIARMSNYKDKEYVLNKLRTMGSDNGTFKVSEDFCKDTQAVRKQIVSYLNYAKANNKDNISGGHIKYKTLVLVFKCGERNVYSHYSLKDIQDNHSWYKQPKVVEN